MKRPLIINGLDDDSDYFDVFTEKKMFSLKRALASANRFIDECDFEFQKQLRGRMWIESPDQTAIKELQE